MSIFPLAAQVRVAPVQLLQAPAGSILVVCCGGIPFWGVANENHTPDPGLFRHC